MSDFGTGDSVSHLYFGLGRVIEVKDETYVVAFIGHDESKEIMKDHSALSTQRHRWSEKDLETAEVYLKKQRRKEQGHRWGIKTAIADVL
jgi:hypothetical protein